MHEQHWELRDNFILRVTLGLTRVWCLYYYYSELKCLQLEIELKCLKRIQYVRCGSSRVRSVHWNESTFIRSAGTISVLSALGSGAPSSFIHLKGLLDGVGKVQRGQTSGFKHNIESNLALESQNRCEINVAANCTDRHPFYTQHTLRNTLTHTPTHTHLTPYPTKKKKWES